jgi:hypothetical protein
VSELCSVNFSELIADQMAMQECKQYGYSATRRTLLCRCRSPTSLGIGRTVDLRTGMIRTPPTVNHYTVLSMSMQDSMPFRGDSWLLFWRMSKESKLE